MKNRDNQFNLVVFLAYSQSFLYFELYFDILFLGGMYMAYNLWLSDNKTIYHYYHRRLNSSAISGQMAIGDILEVFPLPLKIDGIVKEDLWLDEIDSFTCCFRNLDDVRSALRIHSDYRNFADNPGSLMIASSSDDIGKFRVIYDNEFLKECADTIRRKRRNKEPLYLDDTPKVKEFVQKILDYAVLEDTAMSLTNFTILPHPILMCLKNYRVSVLENIGFRDQYFDEFSHYCRNYKILRAFVLFEQDYLKKTSSKEEEKRITTDNDFREREFVYQMMMREEELRRTPCSSPIADTIDSMRDENGSIDFDKVYGIYDLEDIHGLDDTTLQQLGIIPVKLPGKEPKRK